MKIEFLQDGSPDCPLIRLFDFTQRQANQLQQALLGLLSSASSVAIQEPAFVESVENCQLTFEVGRQDDGIIRIATTREFICQLTPKTWEEIAALLEPFVIGECGYQWLVRHQGDANLLLSTTGHW
ncbi:MAG: hypothetical protein WCJ09_11335 [Planctomycetota bacterium]